MTDEQVEYIIKSNMSLQMNLSGIRSDFQEAIQRPWVGLTDEERQDIALEVPMDAVLITEAKLKEKNT